MIRKAEVKRLKAKGQMVAYCDQNPGAATPAAVKEMPIISPAPLKGQKLVRSGAAAGQPGQIVSFANRWRENYNPFRAFAIRKAVEWLEMGQRGDYAMLQWTYRKLERSYPTLSALISRCEAPLLNYKWDIKIVSQPPQGATKAMAGAQQQTLRAAYEGIDDLKNAIRHLHMAEFREYAHIQKHRTNDGEIYHLECLDQWLVCRDGLYGDWFWNPDSKFTTAPAISLGEDNRIGGNMLPREDFIIRQVARPINEIALIAFTRWSLCNKNWDAFIEIYGVPSGVVEMPQNVPADKEKEYEAAARQIAEGGSGAIPNGAKYTPNQGPRDTDPFTPRIKQIDEDLILAGTGGKMGMLNASQGLSGGGQSKTHDDVFREIAEARSSAISECFQREIDAEVLSREHAGEPALVYFELAPREDNDVDGLVKNVSVLATAGFQADPDWLCEQTGYELTAAPIEKEDIRVTDQGKLNQQAEERIDKTVGNTERLKAKVQNSETGKAEG